ncbi:cytochrome b N-terminal domain-containing protein [candidate division KSB1 bacterium]|nr:cytochrome b N-terminal domain-containing protein [candidate division KSB1 bacterium]
MQRRQDKRSPALRMTRNFFLHIHSPRVHAHSLRPGTTLGLGVLAAFLFLILLLSGALLMLYYTPSIERAYSSVKEIIFVVPGGRYIRNMHRWAGHGLVLVAFLHLVRVFYTASYLKGRTLNWIIGIAMLVVTLFLSFSGYLLPWDQLAYWAVTIGANIAASIRELTDALGITRAVDIGGLLKRILIGGEIVGQAALSRFYMLHVVFLPLTLLVLLAVHIWRIRKDGGLSRPDHFEERARNDKGTSAEMIDLENSSDDKKDDQKVWAWPNALWGELTVLMLTLAVTFLLAVFFDAPLREAANPAIPENPAKSPWYFLGIQELVSYSAFAGGILIPAGFIAFLVSIPFIDRESDHIGIWFSGRVGLRTCLRSALFAVVTTIALFAFYIHFGWLRDWLPGAPQLVIILLNPATLITAIYALWSIVIRRSTQSPRQAAMALFTCVMIGYIIFTIIGVHFRGPNWEFYWLKSMWPAP